ncbi:uncharacterized protein SOCE26_031630 [Sorangium cellulosum]|uniref:Uncharacterized protein n=1 Tax=Sorangium cellulosum TaxID=56 RepID=A0A2L0ER47_SORCE|nr:hypothetical protein [Sorangium cellulosum]AUX41740.1 uncharacterized protein SOCE26_031630 [Sorangium cellulosum]
MSSSHDLAPVTVIGLGPMGLLREHDSMLRRSRSGIQADPSGAPRAPEVVGFLTAS